MQRIANRHEHGPATAVSHDKYRLLVFVTSYARLLPGKKAYSLCRTMSIQNFILINQPQTSLQTFALIVGLEIKFKIFSLFSTAYFGH